MRASGSRAYAYARARAWKSRLLTRAEIVALLALTDPERIRRSIEPPFEKLMRIYAAMLQSNRAAAPLLRALLRLHEIENVKLLWRSAVNRRHFDSRLWIQLGTLSTLPATTATTPRQLAAALAKTPYRTIANDIVRAHADDLQAAELSFDRWASRQLLDEVRKLPRREGLARQLIEAVVAQRDTEIVKRGEKYYGLHAGQPSVQPHRPKPIRDLCRRAFRGDPFALAPIVALILLAESEARTVRAIIEREGDPSLDAALERAS